MNRFTPSLLFVALLLAACGAQGGAPDPGASDPPDASDPGPGSDGIEHPTGADEPVLVIDSAGGFVPVDFLATRLPALVLYGDGRVIMQGMQTLEFPGPALPPLIERRMNPDGIQEILAAIEDTNLFGSDLDLRGAQNIVADAADTLFIVNAGGRQVTVSVYGLGTLIPGMEPPPGMPAGELEAHAVLSALNDQLMTLDGWLSEDAWGPEGWQPYEPDAFRLYVRDVSDEPMEGDVPIQVMEWPTDDDPATFGEEQPFFGNGTRCGAVEGDAALAWLEALAEATQMTQWSDDGERRFTVAPRPLLPHEPPDCPELAGA